MKEKRIYPTEFEEQCHIIKWADLSTGRFPELVLLNASSNGVRIPIGASMKLKRQGLKRGFPDLNLPVPNAVTGAHGLYIELKRVKGGTVSPEQKWWLTRLTEQGYRAVVCKGADEAIAEIENYLTGKTVRVE